MASRSPFPIELTPDERRCLQTMSHAYSTSPNLTELEQRMYRFRDALPERSCRGDGCRDRTHWCPSRTSRSALCPHGSPFTASIFKERWTSRLGKQGRDERPRRLQCCVAASAGVAWNLQGRVTARLSVAVLEPEATAAA
jgi:hypothetical protein